MWGVSFLIYALKLYFPHTDPGKIPSATRGATSDATSDAIIDRDQLHHLLTLVRV
jgi:hypothetical protein